MQKTKIVFDVDGVILNFMQTISNYIESTYNLKSKIPYASTQYSLHERFDENVMEEMGFSNIKLAFEKDGYWKCLEPMLEIDLIKTVIDNPEFEVYFVTSIPPHLHGDRQKNLNVVLNTNIPDDHLICVTPGQSKRPHVEKIEPEFFIEDGFPNLVDCHADHTSYWIDHQENYYDLSRIDEFDFKRVKNLNEALEDIFKILAYQKKSHKKITI